MITSKPYSNRSNCSRAARQAIELSKGKITQADVTVDLGPSGYVYTIRDSDTETSDKNDVEASSGTDDVAASADPVLEPVVLAETEVSPRVGTVVLADLDENVWATLDEANAAAEANQIAAANALTIIATDQAGNVVHTADMESGTVQTADVYLCIPFSAEASVMWAAKLSKQLKLQVTIRNGETLEVMQIVESKTVKAARVKVEGSGPRRNGVGETLSNLLAAQDGVTAEVLQKAAGWNTKPSSFYLRKLAKARGRNLVIGKRGKDPVYSFGEQVAA